MISIICLVYCDGAEFKWVPLPNPDVKLITFSTLLCASSYQLLQRRMAAIFKQRLLDLFPAQQIIVLCAMARPCLQVATDKDDENGKDKYTCWNTNQQRQLQSKDKDNCEYSKRTCNNFLLCRLLFSVAAEPLSCLSGTGAPTTVDLSPLLEKK